MKIKTTKVFDEVAEAINQGYRYILLEGSTRSSKSYSASQIAHLLSIARPGYRTLLLSITLQIAKRNLLKDFKKILAGDWRRFGIFKISEMIYEWNNGSETLLLSAENYEKYHGLDSDFILLDEPNLYKEGGKLIEQLSIRCRGTIILTLNPSRKLDWLKAIQARPDCKYIHSTYKDNRFLEQRVIDEIETRALTDERFKRVYVEGLYVASLENAIFINWHISDFYPSKDVAKKVIFGLDFGFANDPTALVELRYFNSKLYIREIFGAAGLTTKEIALELMKIPQGSVIIADNSEPRLLYELRGLVGSHVQILKTIKKKGSINTGIKNLQSIEIILHSNSPYLIEEFELYSWKKINGELTDTPEDKNNHRIDGARYANDYSKLN